MPAVRGEVPGKCDTGKRQQYAKEEKMLKAPFANALALQQQVSHFYLWMRIMLLRGAVLSGDS